MSHIQRFPSAAKAASTNPLKMSQPLGAALAYLGVDCCLPLFHGSQGCTAFGLVLLVRHFREAIPLQTTAMDQVSTILGGYDNLEQAIRTIVERNKPAMIGVATTGVTETKGEDMGGQYTLFRRRNPDMADTALVFANTPDFAGGFEDGFAAAVTAIVERLVEPSPVRIPTQVNVLAATCRPARSRHCATSSRASACRRSYCPTCRCRWPGASRPTSPPPRWAA